MTEISTTDFFTFGEILWDCLPSGQHAGGAPFNVAAHLAQLGVSASLISAVGQDALGDEILQVAQDKGIHTPFVSRARSGLHTGTVQVTLDANANASYEIVHPVAWDEISVSSRVLEAVANAHSFVFGSLAARSPENRVQLHRLLGVPGPMKFFDVNLRPPYADPALVLELGRQADVIKLNDDELGRLASWVKTGRMTPNLPADEAAVASACATLVEAMHTRCLCITRGVRGAVLWKNGDLTSVAAPQVVVKDTVGAGDAFMAGLSVGLTRHMDIRKALEISCRLGAYVASHDGATPLLPPEIIRELQND